MFPGDIIAGLSPPQLMGSMWFHPWEWNTSVKASHIVERGHAAGHIHELSSGVIGGRIGCASRDDPTICNSPYEALSPGFSHSTPEGN